MSTPEIENTTPSRFTAEQLAIARKYAKKNERYIRALEKAKRVDAALRGAVSPSDIDEFDDDETFCREALVVQDKRGELQPAIWGLGQRKLFEAIQKQQQATKPVRVIVLKPRQAFISTGVAMYNFKKTAFFAGQSTLVVAHDEDSAKKIFNYYKRFHQHYHPFHGLRLPRLITPKNLDNPDQDLMKWDNGSYIQVETANNVTGGRSFTARNLHLSEHAFYQRPKEFMTGVMQSVPDDPATSIIIESTANGMGGAFFDEWTRAVEGKSDFTAVFIAWWEHEEYSKPLTEDSGRFLSSLDEEEKVLFSRFRVSFERLNWRRWAIQNKCQGDVDVFRQEYPATPEEAFVTSGRPRFRPIYIRRHVTIEPSRGELRREEIGRESFLSFQPNEHGALALWERPESHKRYVIGADTAEGIDANEGNGTPDSDYSCADVFEGMTRAQVAQLRERLTPQEFGRYLFDLGKWYNWAFIVPEVNSIGQATVDELLRLGYPTGSIYHRVVYDEAGRPRTKKIGYKTTIITREQLISVYEAALAGGTDGGIILRSNVSVREAYGFKIRPNGKAEAEAGQHDDSVFSGGLAAIGLREMPRLTLVESPRESFPKPQRYGKYAQLSQDADRKWKLARM